MMLRRTQIAICAALLGALSTMSVPAYPDILFAGGEDIDFIPPVDDSIQVVGFGDCSGGIFCRPGWARHGINAGEKIFSTPVWSAPSSNFWHRWTLAVGPLAQSLDNEVISWNSPDGVKRLVLRSNDFGEMKLSTRTAAGVYTDLAVSSGWMPTSSVSYKMTAHVVYAVAGSFTLYQDGVSILSYTGDLTTDGAIELNQSSMGNQGVWFMSWSEMIVATTDARSMGLWTVAPDSSGALLQWSGPASPCSTSNLGATSFNDSTFWDTDVTGLLELCAVNTPVPSGGPYAVDAVVKSARMVATASSPQSVRFIDRIGGVNYAGVDLAIPVTAEGESVRSIQSLSPATGLGWTTGDFTAAGYNFGVESRP